MAPDEENGDGSVVMSAKALRWIRVGLAGPGAVLVAQVVMAGMALWLPSGAAKIDNLVLPLILVPLIWSALFFHACLDRRVGRVALIAFGLFAVHATLIVAKFLEPKSVVKTAEDQKTIAEQRG